MNQLHRPDLDRGRLSAAELRRLPLDERNAILEAQAALADPIYRNDARLTDFEAFGEEDFDVDRSSTEAR